MGPATALSSCAMRIRPAVSGTVTDGPVTHCTSAVSWASVTPVMRLWCWARSTMDSSCRKVPPVTVTSINPPDVQSVLHEVRARSCVSLTVRRRHSEGAAVTGVGAEIHPRHHRDRSHHLARAPPQDAGAPDLVHRGAVVVLGAGDEPLVLGILRRSSRDSVVDVVGVHDLGVDVAAQRHGPAVTIQPAVEHGRVGGGHHHPGSRDCRGHEVLLRLQNGLIRWQSGLLRQQQFGHRLRLLEHSLGDPFLHADLFQVSGLHGLADHHVHVADHGEGHLGELLADLRCRNRGLDPGGGCGSAQQTHHQDGGDRSCGDASEPHGPLLAPGRPCDRRG